MTKIPSTTDRDVHVESKTTCFARRGNSVRFGRTVILFNNLTVSGLRGIV